MDILAAEALPYKGVAVALWFALFFLAERLVPAAQTARGWFGDWPRLLRNGGLFAAIFQHSNLRLSGALERPLSCVLITPSIHWVHHHAVRRDTVWNYGTVLSLWDRPFCQPQPDRANAYDGDGRRRTRRTRPPWPTGQSLRAPRLGRLVA